MARKHFKMGKPRITQKKGTVEESNVVLVGTYKARQLAWIMKYGVYNYPVKDEDVDGEGKTLPVGVMERDLLAFGAKVKELWLYANAKGKRYCFATEFVGVQSRNEFLTSNPTYRKLGPSKYSRYMVFKTTFLDYGPRFEDATVYARVSDFEKGRGYAKKIATAIKQFRDGGGLGLLVGYLPDDLAKLPHERLCVCEAMEQMELGIQIESAPTSVSDRITTTKAMQILSLSRHSYDRLISKGILVRHQEGNDAYFLQSDIENAKRSIEYIGMRDGVVDSRNTLNDLTGKDWIPETKSYFYQKGLGVDSDEARIERMHPAPYSFQDIGHLIRFFTKRGMRVLDPFGGVGSTAKACEINGRFCTSIELSRKWHELSIKRLEIEVAEGASKKHNFINGDSCEVLQGLATNSIDFVVTSPPYWGILNKQDQKVKRDRVSQNLDTKYSDDRRDLGNMVDYREFLDVLAEKVFLQCARILKQKKYMAIVVSDFRDKNQFVSFHSDLIVLLNNMEIPCGGVLRLQGTKVLIQNHKSLMPYGYPYAYVENIHHQYILIFRKVS